MKAQHWRPLIACVVVALTCLGFMVHAIRTEALPGLIRSGPARILSAPLLVHKAPEVREAPSPSQGPTTAQSDPAPDPTPDPASSPASDPAGPASGPAHASGPRVEPDPAADDRGNQDAADPPSVVQAAAHLDGQAGHAAGHALGHAIGHSGAHPASTAGQVVAHPAQQVAHAARAAWQAVDHDDRPDAFGGLRGHGSYDLAHGYGHHGDVRWSADRDRQDEDWGHGRSDHGRWDHGRSDHGRWDHSHQDHGRWGDSHQDRGRWDDSHRDRGRWGDSRWDHGRWGRGQDHGHWGHGRWNR